MEILYGVIFIYFGLNLIVFGVGMLNSACYGAFICDLNLIDTGTLFFIFGLLIVGLVFMYIGIRKTMKNVSTNKMGVERYGIVVECWKHINRETKARYYDLKVLIIDDEGKVKMFDEFCAWGYDVGTFLLVKHYKDDINIIDRVSRDLVPDSEKYKLNFECNKYIKNNKDTEED